MTCLFNLQPQNLVCGKRERLIEDKTAHMNFMHTRKLCCAHEKKKTTLTFPELKGFVTRNPHLF